MIKKKEEQQSHRIDLAEKEADLQDRAMSIADDPELIDYYGLDVSGRNRDNGDSK